MTVSAVIPQRNSGPLLEQCIDPLWPRGVDEVVVADEASTADRIARVDKGVLQSLTA